MTDNICMLFTASQAAQRLGISDRQVRRAIDEHVLMAERVGTSYVIHSRQLQTFSRINHRGRHWSGTTQVAALSLLSSQAVEGLSSTEKSRLKQRIRTMELHSLVGQNMRGRDSLRRATSEITRAEIKVSILAELGLSAQGGNTVLVAENATARARELRLAKESTGDIVVVEGVQKHRKVLEACGLFIYGDEREHAAAKKWIEELRSEL